ncbi:MAG: hypothetical protein ACLTFJ_02415 [Clostridium sp.]
MQEYSRILIERYCMEHNSAKSRRLQKLVEMSYDLSAVGTDSELKEAFEDLDDYLFNW